jgi:hypothetical protein
VVHRNRDPGVLGFSLPVAARALSGRVVDSYLCSLSAAPVSGIPFGRFTSLWIVSGWLDVIRDLDHEAHSA